MTTALINETHYADMEDGAFHVSSISTRKEIGVKGQSERV